MRPTFYGSTSLEKPELDCEIPPDLTKGDSNSSRSYKGRFKFQLILQREIQIPADLTKGDSNSSRSEKGGSNFRRSDKDRFKFPANLSKGNSISAFDTRQIISKQLKSFTFFKSEFRQQVVGQKI